MISVFFEATYIQSANRSPRGAIRSALEHNSGNRCSLCLPDHSREENEQSAKDIAKPSLKLEQSAEMLHEELVTQKKLANNIIIIIIIIIIIGYLQQ